MTVHDWLARWSAWGWPLLANHLWQATLFSALCFLAVLLLKRGPSRTRHSIWLIAGLKFAIPSAFLLFLMESAGTVLSRNRILSNVWEHNSETYTNVVDVYVRYLRRKIDHDGEKPLIRTVRGAGYMISE